MFFILNNEKAVLAADKSFLASVGAPSIYLLAELFRSHDFHLDEANHTYQIGGVTRSFTRSTLQTTFGSAYFYQVEDEIVTPGLAIPPATDHTETDTAASSQPDETHAVAEEAYPTAEETAEEYIPATLTLTTPYVPEESAQEGDAATSHPETHPIPDLDLSDLPEPDTDIPEGLPSALLDVEELNPQESERSSLEVPPVTETKTDHPSFETPDVPPPHEDDLLDLLDLDTEPAPVNTETQHTPELNVPEEDDLLDLLDLEEESSSEKPAPATEPVAKLEAEPQEDALIDLLDLETKTDKAEDAFGLDLPTAGAAIAGAGAAMLADEALSPAKEVPEENEIFDLLDTEHATPSTEASDSALLPKEESAQAEPAAPTLPDAPFADYQNNAKMIGITSEEYIGFLKQFTEESLGYEAGLKSKDLYVFKKNLTSIKDASQLLHLPRLSETLNGLEEATSDERHALIDTFFGMIHHIRRDLESEQPREEDRPEPEAKIPDTEPEPPVNVSAPDLHAAPPTTLADVEPIPFDFSTKAASDELGLPETLVQEFVSDFVKQAEENIAVFHEAQQKGDIDTIQKTAHLLKGAASNLRIDPLADTLKELQYNEDTQKVPDLFKQFVGQLKSLINFTNLTDK